MHIPVLVTIWIVIPTFEILTGCLTTDIINGVCVPFGVYSSIAMAKANSSVIIFVAYFLPLSLMIFCYSRIVYTLRTKVTRHIHTNLTEFIYCYYLKPTYNLRASVTTSFDAGLNDGRTI